MATPAVSDPTEPSAPALRLVSSQPRVPDQDLLDELLEAHCDTLVLESQPYDNVRWAAHLAYLRDLWGMAGRARWAS